MVARDSYHACCTQYREPGGGCEKPLLRNFRTFWAITRTDGSSDTLPWKGKPLSDNLQDLIARLANTFLKQLIPSALTDATGPLRLTDIRASNYHLAEYPLATLSFRRVPYHHKNSAEQEPTFSGLYRPGKNALPLLETNDVSVGLDPRWDFSDNCAPFGKNFFS